MSGDYNTMPDQMVKIGNDSNTSIRAVLGMLGKGWGD